MTEEHIEKFPYFSSLTLILSEPPQVMQMLNIASIKYACHYVCIVCINQLGLIHCSEVPVFQTTFQGKKVCLGCREIKKNVGLKVLYSPRKGKSFWFHFSGDSGKQCKCMRNQMVREKGIYF